MENEIYGGQTPAITFEEKEPEVGSLMRFLQFLRRFWIILVVFTLAGTALGLGLALVRDKKVYTQTKSLVVIARIDNATLSTDLSLTKKWWPTLPNTITSPVFISKANVVYGATKTDYISAGSLNVKSGNGMILNVSYSDYDADVAAAKLDAFIRAASEEIQSDEENYVTADKVEFKAIDHVPRTSVSSGFFKYVLLGLVGGLIIALGVAFLIYLFDNTVTSKSELERLTGAMVVAYIDDIA